MRKLIVFIVVCCIVLTSVGCSTKGSEDVAKKTESVENNTPKVNEPAKAEHLSTMEIIDELEKKEYLLQHFKLSYDDYREVYTRYVEDGQNLDDTMLYPAIIGIADRPTTMKEFIGKDIAESKEYYLGSNITNEKYESLLASNDKFMYKMKISEVYPDYSKDDWFHVYVMVEKQGEEIYDFYRKKYTFKKTDDEYKVIHKAKVWMLNMNKKDLEMFTKVEFQKKLDQAPHSDKNYVTEIDMKTLLDEESTEENWDSYFKTE